MTVNGKKHRTVFLIPSLCCPFRYARYTTNREDKRINAVIRCAHSSNMDDVIRPEYLQVYSRGRLQSGEKIVILLESDRVIPKSK